MRNMDTAKKKRKFSDRFRANLMISPVAPILSMLPVILSIFFLTILPALFTFFLTFTNYNGIWEKTKWIWFDNYTSIFTVLRSDVGNALGNTGKYCLMVILPVQILALGSALLVNANIRGKNFFRALFFMPSILGVVVVCAIWKMLLNPIQGPFASLLEVLKLPGSAFLGDPDLSLVLISLIALWASFGFSMAIYLAGLQGISKDYYEAARMDGASGWRCFWRITLPLLWPTVTICLWIAINGTLGMSEYIIFLTDGAHNTTTMAFYIYKITMDPTIMQNQGQVAAVGLVYSMITAVILLLFNKFIRKREVEL